MGNNKSKTTTEQISQNISNIASNTVQDCLVQAYQTQQVALVNEGWSFGSSYKVTQQSDVSMKCFSDVQKQMELQSRLINDIMQETTAEGQSIWPAFGSNRSEAANTIKNIVESNITLNNIQRSYMEIRQEQNVSFNNKGVMAFSDVEIAQGNKLFAAATLKEVERAGIFTAIENYVDQTAASSTAGPFDSLLNTFGSVGTVLIIAFVFIVVVILGILATFYWRGKTDELLYTIDEINDMQLNDIKNTENY
jgi:hypothetical protein